MKKLIVQSNKADEWNVLEKEIGSIEEGLAMEAPKQEAAPTQQAPA
jgi:hypothetical protein